MSHDISTLTLEQKASLLSGGGFWTTKALDEVGIPSILLTDGPHGIRRQDGPADHLGINDALPSTCFPPAVAVGSSWDPEIAAQVGAAVGREALAAGVAVVLGPGVNIKRSPLCGRNFEYYSEDPLLSGVLGAAHVSAMQEVGPGASVKHFAANNQETERMRISADVDERTLREIYLPAFERVVKEAAPATVMASYNKVNGTYASQNRWLLTDVLRTEWGFEGAVVSDWGAVSDRVAGVESGMDLEMPASGGATDQRIVDAVRSGRLSEEAVDTAVRRVLALTELPHEPSGAVDVDGHHALARRLAADSAVLLKNDAGVLPLHSAPRLAVIGAFAAEPRFQGGGSSHLTPTRVDTALDAIRELAHERGTTVEYADGFLVGADDPDEAERRARAVDVAARADIAIVFAGLGDREESEGFDRSSLELPAAQVELLGVVAAAAPRTVVVLSNGGVVSLEGWHDDVDAILEGWLLGQAGGSAIADLLFGVVNPSGRLAETIPLRLQDTPSVHTFPGEQGHVRYGEGVMVGYRHYETAAAPVRYPFGHGLGYTAFATSDLLVEKTGDDSARVELVVTNTGAVAGRHVVQVYVSTDAGPVRRPRRELRAFAKIGLRPGESRTVSLELDRRAFAYWDIEQSDWIVPGGEYAVQIGENASRIVAEKAIVLAGDVLVRPLTLDSTVGEWFAHPVVGPALRQGLAAGMSEEQAREAEANEDGLKMVESMPMQQFVAFTGGAFPPEALEQLMALSTADPVPA
ncbi:beta-glucosidase [Rathayibacter sp. Leaf299]|uniref:glycoside hydrolase family 3 C-terminal domain-containing protein n=1 Tax=Rathayibacter sp. Leaf299 TaxID=1736328 RepID=UPI0006FDA89F|nr:glycoside hydrolase family 3 C-terminal domain-containing protein [Rathayibacter sp. Leaf299]KQQ20734.1 beta-glucosidase [Rathayibacter sp. Leaf299]